MPVQLFIPWFQLKAVEVSLPWVGDMTIHPFGFIVALGILVATRIAEQRAKVCDVPQVVISDLVLYIIPTALLSAYVLNGVYYHPDLLREAIQDPSILARKYLGLSSYGGFIGGILGALLWKHRNGMSLIKAGDPIAYALPAGWFIGRSGCFLVHDHPGIVTDFPLAVNNYRLQGVARHDLGLYEALFALALFALFVYLGKRPRKSGFFLILLSILYAPVRFLFDFLRAPPESGGDTRYFGLTPAQYGSLALFFVGVFLLYRLFLRASRPEFQPPHPEAR